MNKNAIIDVKNLSFGYNTKILNKVSFQIEKGEFVAIVGPNGAGKSTLVKLLTNLLKKEKGTIKINGKISYIPQKFNQDINFPATVKELLNLECCSCNTRDNICKSLNVKKLEHKQFRDLSGGQQQRVFVAMSLLSEPDILILDEPTVGIDTKTQEDFYKLLYDLNKKQNITILFITHDTGMIYNYFSKIMCISNGEVFIENSKNYSQALEEAYGESFAQLSHEHNHENEKMSSQSQGPQKHKHNHQNGGRD